MGWTSLRRRVNLDDTKLLVCSRMQLEVAEASSISPILLSRLNLNRCPNSLIINIKPHEGSSGLSASRRVPADNVLKLVRALLHRGNFCVTFLSPCVIGGGRLFLRLSMARLFLKVSAFSDPLASPDCTFIATPCVDTCVVALNVGRLGRSHSESADLINDLAVACM